MTSGRLEGCPITKPEQETMMTMLSRRDTLCFAAALTPTIVGLRLSAPDQVAATPAPISQELILPSQTVSRIILSISIVDHSDTNVVGIWPGHGVADLTRLGYPRQRTKDLDCTASVDRLERAVQGLVAEMDPQIPLSTLTPWKPQAPVAD